MSIQAFTGLSLRCQFAGIFGRLHGSQTGSSCCVPLSGRETREAQQRRHAIRGLPEASA